MGANKEDAKQSLNEYSKLTDELEYLTLDVVYIINARDDVQDCIFAGLYGVEDLAKIDILDKKFKSWAVKWIKDYQTKVKQATATDIEKATLLTTDYPYFRDKRRWWFHLKDLVGES